MWNTSNRRSRLPGNWPRITRRILARDKHTCKLHYPGCLLKATEVDHINRGDDHTDRNLQAVCKKCHATKSAREGRQAQLQRKALGKRPPESHPGLKNDRHDRKSGAPSDDNS